MVGMTWVGSAVGPKQSLRSLREAPAGTETMGKKEHSLFPDEPGEQCGHLPSLLTSICP